MSSPKDDILRMMYKKPARWFFENYELDWSPSRHPVALGQWLDDYTIGYLESSCETPYDAVAGGPCLDYCDGNLHQLTLQSIVDILYPLTVARSLGKPCVLYIEPHYHNSVSEAEQDQWEEVCSWTEKFARRLGTILGVTNIVFFRADNQVTRDIVDSKIRGFADLLSPGELRGLYSLDTVTKGPLPGETNLIWHQRAVAGYLPSVVQAVTGHCFRRILIAESLQQLKAVQRARHIISTSLEKESGVIDMSVFLPAPGLSGKSRMSRASVDNRILLNDDHNRVIGRLSAAPVAVRYFWSHIWPDELLRLSSDQDVEPILQALSAISCIS